MCVCVSCFGFPLSRWYFRSRAYYCSNPVWPSVIFVHCIAASETVQLKRREKKLEAATEPASANALNVYGTAAQTPAHFAQTQNCQQRQPKPIKIASRECTQEKCLAPNVYVEHFSQSVGAVCCCAAAAWAANSRLFASRKQAMLNGSCPIRSDMTNGLFTLCCAC